MKNTIKLIALAILACAPSYATIIVHGDSKTAPFGFTSMIVVNAYDQHTGTFYLGIENQASFPSGDFSLAKATRPSPSTIAKFTAIGSNEILKNETLESLIIIPAQNDPEINKFNPPLLGMLILNSQEFTQRAITVSTTTGSSVLNSAELADANGSTTEGINAIAANSCFVAAAVRPNDGSDFGADGSGIALVSVQASPLTLRTVDANTGLPGNLAVPFNGSITQLSGNGPDAVNFAFDSNSVSMIHDEILDRFYIGVRISTGGDPADIGKSVVVANTICDEGNRLELFDIVADSAIDPIADEIVVVNNADVSLSAMNLGVMHCSTGPDYLIVNGGQGATDQVGNLVFAMPLVNDPCSEELNGTLANANSELSADCNHVFTQPAENPGDLLSADDPRAVVGTGPLPIQANQQISQMVVSGDAVYVSIDIAPECGEEQEITNDTGIFYSQALFDATGRIAGWTPWKRATPFDAFPSVNLEGCLSHDGQVKFFQIDAKTGNAWIVEGTTDRFVGYLNWTSGACKNGLIKQVNELLCNGSYSVLDLNQQTRGFLNATIDRYALFGGVDRVAIARISQACDISELLSPETVTTDFRCCTDIFIDSLPESEMSTCPAGAGCVTSLEYSRRTSEEGDQNYFFAGTETGLYAFSVDGAGFNVNQLEALDQDPFISGSWSLIEGIDGAVIDIKTSGAKLYVLTLNHSCEQPFINTLYSIPFADTLEAMFDEANISIIAQNQVGAFADVTAFFAIAIIATGPVDDPDISPATKEQLILATSNGLFKSNADQVGTDGIIDATDQEQANWELVGQTDGIAFDGIGFIDAPIEYTVWPISIADACTCRTFDRSNIDQLSGTGNPGDEETPSGTFAEIGEFEPFSFNACSCFEKFKTLYPITYFWTDGGRRFFVINRTTASAQRTEIAVMPFQVTAWNVNQFEPLFNPALEQFKQINWVRNVGASGLVLAGTNRGIIGLE